MRKFWLDILKTIAPSLPFCLLVRADRLSIILCTPLKSSIDGWLSVSHQV
jgi:hypothetical protein